MPVGEGGGDLFSGKQRQTDIADVKPVEQSGIEQADKPMFVAEIRKIGDKYAIVTKNQSTGESHAYYSTEAEARAAASRIADDQDGAARNREQREAEYPTELIRSEGNERSGELGLKVQQVLDRRETSSITSANEAIRKQSSGELKQLPGRAGYCFRCAAEGSSAGIGDMVIGIDTDADGNKIWHAVVQRDGHTYDPTFSQWFAPGVYEALGFTAVRSMSPSQVKEFVRNNDGYVPDAKNQGLPENPQEYLDSRVAPDTFNQSPEVTAKTIAEASVQDLVRATAAKMDEASKPQEASKVDNNQGKVDNETDAIGEAIKNSQTRDQFTSYLRGRLGKEEFVKQQAEIERRWDEAKQEEADQGNTMFSRQDSDFVQEVISELAAVDEFFRFPVSESRSLEQVMADIFPEATYSGEDTRVDERAESGADRRFMFKTKPGKTFYVFERGNEVWIDVSRLEEGGGGSAIYAAVGNYAHNTSKRFVGDPSGLSEAAIVRRTSNMLSLALRFGTTRFMEASPEQIKGVPEKGIAPLDWGGNDVAKTRALIDTFVTTTRAQNPEIKDYHYDFQRREFVDKRGNSITRGRFVAGSERPAARSARAGEATLRRGIFLQSLVSSESGQRPGILEQVLNRGHSLVNQGGLQGLF